MLNLNCAIVYLNVSVVNQSMQVIRNYTIFRIQQLAKVGPY